MSDKNQSGKNAQLSLLDILGLAGDIEGKYSSDEIEKVIGKLRAPCGQAYCGKAEGECSPLVRK